MRRLFSSLIDPPLGGPFYSKLLAKSEVLSPLTAFFSDLSIKNTPLERVCASEMGTKGGGKGIIGAKFGNGIRCCIRRRQKRESGASIAVACGAIHRSKTTAHCKLTLLN